MTTPELWTAIYLPALPDPSKNPTRSDLPSREAAEQYMFSMMCKDCQEERRLALAGVQYYPGTENDQHPQENSEFPPCCCEWLVMPTDKYGTCESFDDLMDAVGAKVILDRRGEVAVET